MSEDGHPLDRFSRARDAEAFRHYDEAANREPADDSAPVRRKSYDDYLAEHDGDERAAQVAWLCANDSVPPWVGDHDAHVTRASEMLRLGMVKPMHSWVAEGEVYAARITVLEGLVRDFLNVADMGEYGMVCREARKVIGVRPRGEAPRHDGEGNIEYVRDPWEPDA